MNLDGKVTNPGELRTLITLYRRAVTTGTGGFQRPTLGEALATVYCRWTNAHGGEVWAAQSVSALQPATVLMRYREDIDPTCYLMKGDQTYEIVSMDNIRERGDYMELKVKRMVEG